MDYDIAIVGGGIHGVGVAQAAAAAGYKTILFEQNDQLAQGTSSKSSKLIHGGLRYLEQLKLELVRECLVERKVLLANAPCLVKLKPVYIPIYTNSKRSSALIQCGLSLYRLLSAFDNATRFQRIPKQEWSSLQNLNTANLKAVYQYFEAQTDDQLLTQAVMRSAISLGAHLKLSSTVRNIRLQNDCCVVRVSTLEQSLEFKIKVVVNAAGAWSNEVLKNVAPTQKIEPVDLVQGSHILLPCFLGDCIYYVESVDDRRPVFVMPWQGKALVGTTEKLFEGDPSTCVATQQEISYLLRTFNYYFPSFKPTEKSVVSRFAGLRVLPKSNKNPNKRSRETKFVTDRKDSPRIVSIFGGKLTSYRATADKALQILKESLSDRPHVADTTSLNLCE